MWKLNVELKRDTKGVYKAFVSVIPRKTRTYFLTRSHVHYRQYEICMCVMLVSVFDSGMILDTEFDSRWSSPASPVRRVDQSIVAWLSEMPQMSFRAMLIRKGERRISSSIACYHIVSLWRL